jgi:hypothetical protein
MPTLAVGQEESAVKAILRITMMTPSGPPPTAAVSAPADRHMSLQRCLTVSAGACWGQVSRLCSGRRKPYTAGLSATSELCNMADREEANHWDLLAAELGAKPPLEEAREEAGVPAEEAPPEAGESSAAEPSPPQSPPKEPPLRPGRGAANWETLASELGIAPQLAVPGPTAQEPLPWPGEEHGHPEEAAELPQGAAPEQESVLTEEEPGVAAGLTDNASAGAFADAFADVGDALDEGDALEESAGLELELAEAASASAGEEAVAAAPTADEALSPKDRAKHRRRRRPSHKRKKGAEPEEKALNEQSPAAKRGERRQARKHSPVKTTKSAATSAPADEEEQDEEDAKGSKAGSTGHRAIPTWEEAVGMIVAANVEARARRPSRGPSHGRSRDRGAGKGQGPPKGRRSKRKPPPRKN